MTNDTPPLERIGFWLVVASLGLVQFKLMAGQIVFGLAAIAWLAVTVRDERGVDTPPFFAWLAAYGAWTLLSAGFSLDPIKSFIDSKQLVLFLMVPMVARLARGDRAMTALNVIIAVGAAGAVLGVVEYALLGFDNLGNRPKGLLNHYMTYSGVIMIVLTAAVARLLFYSKQRVWPGIAIPALAVALAVTYARNAWIGALAAITGLLAARRLQLLLVVPVVIAAFLLLAPASIRNRATSMFDPNEDSNRDRLQMLAMGRDMVKDHPLFGVGPEMVQRVYTQYLQPNPVHVYNPHLHNVPVQIAAERGVPALLIWLGFIVVAAIGMVRQMRSGPAPAIAAAGLGAIVALLAAGLFEYNFGDSEVLMLFLGVITLPYAASRSSDAA